MIALTDVNSFYPSAEVVFEPHNRGKPLIVLTNNDGCVAALNRQAKELNIPRFAPYFQIKELCEKHKVIVRSSNYELYSDLSMRFASLISEYSPNVHIYSIDESFADLSGQKNLLQLGADIRRRIWTELRLPVCVGIGETITLAKAANHAAKKIRGYHGVCFIESSQQREAILSQMDVEDVWGVGRRIAKRLKLFNIHKAIDLAKWPPKHAKTNFNILLEQTVRELNGEPVKEWDTVRADKQQIWSTRSFGERITDIESLYQALAKHCAIAAKKLRDQGSVAQQLIGFAASSSFDETPQSFKILHRFEVPTNDTSVIAGAVRENIHQLFKPGVPYYRAGIGLVELRSECNVQLDIFAKDRSNPKLMQCLDAINNRFGNGTALLAGEGIEQKWDMRREYLSPQYTTNWRHIPKIRC
ncbi:Y-family DNA polymerase [Motilimonas eburnea]|uniref:Y-family DNA polymerase n=1 Tax=Motilimonas eburnea TaxID=1737488 RepID=UPI001E3819F0|nr:Y-family DNA polymerase [Motilimonas eburnea]MCE2571823.1 Y-family DNA polymerase [Motilimonas eburnea]